MRLRAGPATVELSEARVVQGAIEGRPVRPLLLRDGIRLVDAERGRIAIAKEVLEGPVEVKGNGDRALAWAGVIGGSTGFGAGAAFFLLVAHAMAQAGPSIPAAK